MRSEDGLHVGHTAVADFNRIFVEDLVEFGSRRKLLADQFQKCSADVCSDVFAEWWIKPSDIASSAAFLVRGLFVPVHNSFSVATFLQCVFIEGGCISEDFCVV